MADQVLKVPGFYPREVEKVVGKATPSGVPYGIIGPAERGRAFFPITVGSPEDFESTFVDDGESCYPSTYAARETLKSKNALTFMRVLGCGANTTTTHFERTRTTGIVNNAGMFVSGTSVTGDAGRHSGAVQFLAAQHVVTSSEVVGYPMFSDNSSYGMTLNQVQLIRAMLMTTSDARFMVMDAGETFSHLLDDATQIDDSASTSPTYRKFKLVLSSSAGSSFATTDGFAGIKVLTASLDPSNADYIGRILNTDPTRFESEKHYLYAHFPVDNELATVVSGVAGVNCVCLLSGSNNTSSTSGDTSIVFRNVFGHFDTRYTCPRTPTFISQPFGKQEHDLFYFEPIDDGKFANSRIKASIRNLRASNDPRNEYGTFSILIRDFDDTDYSPIILEQFHNVNLNPESENYIGKLVGDIKVSFNFDAEDPEDRRYAITGKFPNKSRYVRVSVNDSVERKTIPATSLPFGFRGIPVVNTNDKLMDSSGATFSPRLALSGSSITPNLSGSIVPPLPLRFKVTRGNIGSSGNFLGEPGAQEVVDSRLYWGVKFERNTNVLNPNVSSERNELIESFTKLQGLSLLDAVVTGSAMDSFNDNKFTLARVALTPTSFTTLTASADVHMKEAAYFRNGNPASSDSRITDGSFGQRITFATLVQSSSVDFNRFSEFAKFTTIFYGGWDGTNIFDKHASNFDDRSTSTESGSRGYGLAHTSYTSPGATTGVNYTGVGINNSCVHAYNVASTIMTDRLMFDGNVLSMPSQRDPLVADTLMDFVKRVHQLCFGIVDIPTYDPNGIRIFDNDSNVITSVEKTADNLDSRVIDNNACATYFPNFAMEDAKINRSVMVPASVAALAAFAFTDKVAFPWWVSAGLNRASLNFVSWLATRIKVSDQERLFDSRINPIVKMANENGRTPVYAIADQKTLQQAQTALNSINIKRMLLEARRQIVDAALKTDIVWEQITNDTRSRFVKMATTKLAAIQSRSGIKEFKIICDDTNNSSEDVRSKRMNGVVLIKPVYAVEYIPVDFVALPSGISFID